MSIALCSNGCAVILSLDAYTVWVVIIFVAAVFMLLFFGFIIVVLLFVFVVAVVVTSQTVMITRSLYVTICVSLF